MAKAKKKSIDKKQYFNQSFNTAKGHTVKEGDEVTDEIREYFKNSFLTITDYIK